MTEIEAIRARHSVRRYKDAAIEKEKIDLLNACIDECNATGKLHFQLCEDAGNTFNRLLNKAMGLGSAPSVIACIGPDDSDLDARIGYYGQKIVLYAQQLGLNTCWAGTYNKKGISAKVGEGERLVLVIAIGYGENQGKPRKSRTAAQVSKCEGNRPEWFDFAVEMALLAPTAINQQKFEIMLGKDGVVTFTDKGGVHSKVDLGIVRYNFEVGEKYAKNRE